MTIYVHQQTGALPAPRGAGPRFIVEGGLLLAIGVLAAALPQFAGSEAALIFGSLLVLSGLVGFAALVASRAKPHLLWRIMFAAAAIIAGAVVVWAPLAGALDLVLRSSSQPIWLLAP
jgi:uncharacterized membrane protein HdeD (DUF308 family)